jgi:hypothetical protein
VARAAAHEPDQVEEDRVAALGELLRVVLRWQPDVNLPHERIAEGVALQHLRRVRETATRPDGLRRCLVGTVAPELLRNDSL